MNHISSEEQKSIISAFKNAISDKCELQDDILMISENSLDRISIDLQNKFKCFITKESAHNFLLLLYSFIQIRPLSIPLYGKLLQKVSKQISPLISAQELMILFSPYKLIVLNLLESNLIKIENIISYLNQDKTYIFYFSIEIRKHNPILFGQIVSQNEKLEDFLLSVSDDEHDSKRRTGLNDGVYESMIRNGEVVDINPNQKVTKSIYENSEFLTQITYAEYAAFFGCIESLKRFLGYSNIKSDKLLVYAIAGGQKEALNYLLQQNSIKFKITHECIRTSINFQRTDDIDITVDIQEKKEEETNITLTKFYSMFDKELKNCAPQAKLMKYGSWNKSVFDNENCLITVNINGKPIKKQGPDFKCLKKYVSINDVFLSMQRLNWHYFVDNLIYVSDQINIPCDDDNGTLLHFACLFGYKEVVKLLLSMYGDKNYFEHKYEDDKDFDHHPDCVDKRNKPSFINVNVVDSENRTPLHLAIMNEKVEVVKILLKCDDTEFCIRDKKGKTVIHYLAERKSRQLIPLFFTSCPNHDIDISIPDNKGNTAFHYFCKPRCFDPKILRYVCSSTRVNTSHLNHKNVTELMHAIIKKKRLDILEVLASCKEVDLNFQTPDKKETALMIASRKDIIDALKILMKYKDRIDPNIQNIKLRTALHIAVYSVSPKCLDYLIREPSVNTNIIDDFELTPAFVAIYKRSYRLFDLIMSAFFERRKNYPKDENNIDLNLRDHFSQSLLNYCIRTQHFHGIEILLKFFNINEIDSKGTSCFHQACAVGNLDIIQFLVKSLGTVDVSDKEDETKIKINLADSNGLTPFHYACQSGSLNVVKYLMQLPGIKINEKDFRGEIPFFYACKYGFFEIAKVLVNSKQINPYSTNFNGIPAISYLSEQDRKNIFL